MIKMQHALLVPLALKALHKGTEQSAAKNASHGPDNVRTRTETLNDSLEEIGMMFSEKMERKNKALNRRNLQSNLLRNKHAIGKIDELTHLFELLDNNDNQRTEEQLSLLRDALNQSPPPDSDALVEAAGGDAARCDVLLRILEQQAHVDGNPELASKISGHLDRLQHTHGETIRAGTNTARAIAEHTRDPQRKQSLRNLYYDTIVHKQSAVMMLDMLLKEVESRYLLASLRTLQRALSDDIAALAPSISIGALCCIQRGLRDAAQISQTLANCSAFVKRMETKLPEVAMTGLTLTRRALQISYNGAYESDFHHLAEEVVGQHTTQLPLFYAGLFPLIHGLPPSLWQEPESRKDALTLLRNMIGEASKDEQQANMRKDV